MGSTPSKPDGTLAKLSWLCSALEGAEYALYEGGAWEKGHQSPFYCADTPWEQSKQNIRYIHEHGLNCAGLVNLVLRSCGAQFPAYVDPEYPGGTMEPELIDQYADQLGLLPLKIREGVHSSSFRTADHPSSRVPSGSLLLAPCYGVDSQGHYAFVVDDENGFQKVWHCRPDPEQPYDSVGRVARDAAHWVVDKCKRYTFTHYCPPEKWPKWTSGE